MKFRSTTLRQRLLVSFIAASVVPLSIAMWVSTTRYSTAVTGEAERTLETNVTVEQQLITEDLQNRTNQVASVARSYGREGTTSQAGFGRRLADDAKALDMTELMFIDTSDVAKASTAGTVGHKIEWDQLRRVSKGDKPSAFVGVVPITELVSLGVADKYELAVKETKGGSAGATEVAGALAVVAVAPVKDAAGVRRGSVVGMEILKLDNRFVDSVVAKVGGVATVFQYGVRVQTTVIADDGKRAVGTAISDPVRAVVLGQGKPFRGQAFVVNKPYFAAYEPLKDPDGQVVGALFTGLDQAPYLRDSRNFSWLMGAVVLLGIISSGAMAWIGSGALSRPLVVLNNAAQQVATGDLRVEVPETGFAEAKATGRAFNMMTGSLRDLIEGVHRSSHRLGSVSGEISQVSRTSADSATMQASAVAQTTATLEELDRSFGSVADGARRVLEIAEDSLEVAEDGRDAVRGSVGHVSRLANEAQTTLMAAGGLNEVAEDIGQITFVIASIAEQTKILALNAAIEAARAGEAGRGFGVVATEIRTLADSVSTSVGRISQLVAGIQNASRDLAATAEQQAQMGAEAVSETERTVGNFDEIYARMSRTADAAREISAAAQEQQSAARQIVDVMQQVNQSVSATAASSRQLADASDDVAREASSLEEGLRGFKTGS